MTRALLPLLLTLPTVAHAGWDDPITSALTGCEADPAPCDAVNNLLIRETRAGTWMVQDEALEDPAIIGPLLHRVQSTDEPQRKGALVGALVRILPDSDPVWHPAFIALAAAETDDDVRVIWLRGMRRAPPSVAQPVLTAGLQHEDETSRRHAAQTMAGHATLHEFVPALLARATDEAPLVRAAVARALGWSADPRAAATLDIMQTDADAVVRERAAAARDRLR